MHETQIQTVMFKLGKINPCQKCGTALRYGDYECSHCGEDLEDQLRIWASELVKEIFKPIDSKT